MSKSAKFAIRINSDLLHELVQAVAIRAYIAGAKDVVEDKLLSTDEMMDRVRIDPQLLRKFL